MYKRILLTICCLCLCFVTISRPVFAAEVAEEHLDCFGNPIPLPDISELEDITDIIYEVDENGYIVGNKYQPYVLGESLLLGLGGTASSIAPPLGILLLILIGAGIIIDNAPGWKTELEVWWNNLSVESKNELTSISDSAVEGEQFTVSSSTMTDVKNIYDDMYLSDEQVKALPFDASGMLAYGSVTPGYGNQLLTDVFKYTYASCTPGQFVVNEPFSILDGKCQLQFIPNTTNLSANTITFTRFTLINPSNGIFYSQNITNTVTSNNCIHDFKVSDPVVRTFTSADGFTWSSIGFYFLDACTNSCSCGRISNGQKYYIKYVDALSTSGSYSTQWFKLTGDSLDSSINDIWFSSWYAREDSQNVQWYYGSAVGGVSSIYVDRTPSALALSDSYTVSKVGTGQDVFTGSNTGDQQEEKVLWYPHSGVWGQLENVDSTDVIDGSYVGSESGGEVIDPGIEGTLWERLWGYLQNIIDSIVSLPDVISSKFESWLDSFDIWFDGVIDGINSLPDVISSKFDSWLDSFDTWFDGVIDGITSLPGTIVDGITSVLENLFVPDMTAYESLIETYTSKFGWVTDLYNFGSRLIDSLAPDEPPKIPIKLSAAEGKINWGDDSYILDMSWYSRYKASVDTILSGIIWLFFGWAYFRRIPDILSGVGLVEENRTLPSGHVFKERAERESRRNRRK